MKGRSNGSYPENYRDMLYELFGLKFENAIEVCSGDVHEPGVLSVDIKADKNPDIVCDAQQLPGDWTEQFERWYCDPPYNQQNAEDMYGTSMPNISSLLREGTRVVKPGSLLFLLLGAVNRQSVVKMLDRIGLIFITIVPNNEIRCLHIYRKKISTNTSNTEN